MTVWRTSNSSEVKKHLIPGPIAIIRDEDGVDLGPTIVHHQSLGFQNVIVIGRRPPDGPNNIIFMAVEPSVETASVVNNLMDVVADRWIYLGHNAEYLYFPFCEGRSVADALQFVEEERRASVFTMTLDLYQPEIDRNAPIWTRENAHFDAKGYYSKERYDGSAKLERQIDVFGGLKWRYAEHIEWARQRVNRISIFKAGRGLMMDSSGLFNNPEMNTISSPWHHSMTACVASFRVAKSLINNPGSTYEIDSFMWGGSKEFRWTSHQLMELGMMEPGQWF